MRNGTIFSLSLVLLLSAPGLHARSLDSLASALAAMSGYSAEVEYAVTLPQAEEDVVYRVELIQPSDNPESYLIDWSTQTPGGPLSGFTAWFDGNFYNFRNGKLQESHPGWGPQTGADRHSPQNSVQFASLLPTRIAAELQTMAADTAQYTLTLTEKADALTVEALRHRRGITDAELRWTFALPAMTPLSFSADYNPGSISGQQIYARYSACGSPSINPGEPLDEAALKSLYPDVFANCRQSNFAIENMRGRQLPAFSLPLAGGNGRYTRDSATAPLDGPTAVVLINPDAGLSPRLVTDVREAVARLPREVSVLWACVSKDPEAISGLLGENRRGETAAMAAGGLALECGAASLPVIMVCESSGSISNIIIGVNNQLRDDVIQLLSRIK